MIKFLKMANSKKNFGAISGATGFIGRLLSFHYAELGCNLILIGRNYQKLVALQNELMAISDISIIIVKSEFETNFINGISEDLTIYASNIYFFVNTIGSQDPIGPFLENSDDDWTKNIYVNLIIPAILSKFFAKVFKVNGGGTIIVFGGGGASSSRPNFSSYATAKAGLARFVETFSNELNGSGVTINMLAPGIMPSEMMNQIIDNSKNAGTLEVLKAQSALTNTGWLPTRIIELSDFLIQNLDLNISGKLISAEWDNWRVWIDHITEINGSDLYTLRRITNKDRGLTWGEQA